MQQADHEVAYELRKTFDKFKALRQEMRSRGFTVIQPMRQIHPGISVVNEDDLHIYKSTTVTY